MIMSQVDKFISFMFLLCGLINFCPAVLAAQENTDVIADRPQVEYKSGGLRDPFTTYIIQEKKVNVQVEATPDFAQMEAKFSELKVQGIIWGTKMPQAIINDKVYTVGDKVDEAEISSIDNKGINLSTAAGMVHLAAPGQAKVSNEDNMTNTPALISTRR